MEPAQLAQLNQARDHCFHIRARQVMAEVHQGHARGPTALAAAYEQPQSKLTV